jgi:hypothetical protein
LGGFSFLVRKEFFAVMIYFFSKGMEVYYPRAKKNFMAKSNSKSGGGSSKGGSSRSSSKGGSKSSSRSGSGKGSSGRGNSGRSGGGR